MNLLRDFNKKMEKALKLIKSYRKSCDEQEKEINFLKAQNTRLEYELEQSKKENELLKKRINNALELIDKLQDINARAEIISITKKIKEKNQKVDDVVNKKDSKKSKSNAKRIKKEEVKTGVNYLA